MDVSDVLRRLWTRRWAVLVVLVLAVGAGLAGVVTAGRTLQSSAAVLIVPPPLGDAVSEQNPLLNLDNNLAQLATVLASAMQSSAVDDALARAGADGSFEISTVTGTNPSFAQLSPQLVFTVTAPDADTAELTARVLVRQADVQLTSLQTEASVPTDARATLVQVVAPTSAVANDSGRLRSAGAFGLVTVVLGLLVVLAVDELLRRRALARGPAGTAPAAAAPTPRQAKAARVAAAQAARDARRRPPPDPPPPAEPPPAAPVEAAPPAKATKGAGTKTGGNRSGANGSNRAGGSTRSNGSARSGGSRSRRSR